jgi:hypothetical protein
MLPPYMKPGTGAARHFRFVPTNVADIWVRGQIRMLERRLDMTKNCLIDRLDKIKTEEKEKDKVYRNIGNPGADDQTVSVLADELYLCKCVILF